MAALQQKMHICSGKGSSRTAACTTVLLYLEQDNGQTRKPIDMKVKEEFENSTEEIRIRKSKEDRQHNDQKIKDKRKNNDLQNTEQ